MSSGNYPSRSGRGGRPNDRYYDQYYEDDGYYGSSTSYRGNYRGRGRGSYRGRGNDYYNSRSYLNSGYGGYYNSRGGGYSGYNSREDYRGDAYEAPKPGQERRLSEENRARDRDHSPEQVRSPYHSTYDTHNGNFRGSSRGRGMGSRGRGGYSHSSYRPYYEENRGRDSPASTRTSVSSHRETKILTKAFKNPWINILKINDPSSQQKLESKYVELERLDKELIELQRSRLKLEIAVENVQAQVERENVHVQITNEKLEEFNYL